MLTFNLLLTQAGIDPSDVYLVRHQDTRIQSPSIYSRYKSDLKLFETYQKLQSRDCFGKRSIIASFIAAPQERTLFIGLYLKHGLDEFPATLCACPHSGEPVSPSTHFFYALEPDTRLDEFKEKMTIDWGLGYRSWIQNADSKDSGNKKILEIFRSAGEEDFPGYREFRCDMSEILFLWPTWQQALRQSKGIYLLTCKETGRKYVGKADGDDGFWGRFLQYALTTHGGNEGMKKHSTSGYSVTILEALATPTQGELDRLESLWKSKLGSRLWGLNEN